MTAQLVLDVQMFEAGMLVCFGLSWPVSVFKTFRTRRTEGKSLAFMVLVWVGYCSGMAAKFVAAAAPGKTLDWVTALYAVNWLLVALDIALYLRYSRAARQGAG